MLLCSFRRAAGTVVVGLLLLVSWGETPSSLPESRAGVRTHLAMQALLGLASRGGSRRELLRECWRLWRHHAPYATSREEMTPVRLDWISALPLALAAGLALARPSAAAGLARGGFGAHLLGRDGIRKIESTGFG